MVPKGGSPRSFPPAAGGAYQGGGGGRGGGRGGGGGMMNNRGASNMVGGNEFTLRLLKLFRCCIHNIREWEVNCIK